MRIGSLFTGYGGLDLAVQSLLPDSELVWIADNDPACSVVLDARFSRPNLGDVTRVDWDSVPRVDVLTGGTPCQDVSHAGKRAGMTAGTRSNLWTVMREAIAIIRPSLVVWENVRGVLSADAETDMELCPRCMGETSRDQPRLRAFGRVLGDLASIGYDASWCALRASDVGAPHLRTRVFLLAWDSARVPDWDSIQDAAPDVQRGHAVLALLGTPAASIYRDAGPIGSPSHTARLERSYLDAQAKQLGALRFLPTPVVNDMGEGKTVDWWDEWAPRQRAADGTTAVHGPSLAIEAQRPDAWGKFGPAIERWTRIFRDPPPLVQDDGRLSPAFEEWMMGLPAGWVTDPELGLTRQAAMRALGNGVVPQQGTAALVSLVERIPR